jgi:hypothetical protein
MDSREYITGRQPPPLSSVLYGIILKDVPYWPHNYYLEKNQVPRELALIAISLACLVWLNDIHMVEAENELPNCLS